MEKEFRRIGGEFASLSINNVLGKLCHLTTSNTNKTCNNSWGCHFSGFRILHMPSFKVQAMAYNYRQRTNIKEANSCMFHTHVMPSFIISCTLAIVTQSCMGDMWSCTIVFSIIKIQMWDNSYKFSTTSNHFHNPKWDVLRSYQMVDIPVENFVWRHYLATSSTYPKIVPLFSLCCFN